MDKVLDRLYLGNIEGATNLFMLKRMVKINIKPVGSHSYFISCSRSLTYVSKSNLVIV